MGISFWDSSSLGRNDDGEKREEGVLNEPERQGSNGGGEESTKANKKGPTGKRAKRTSAEGRAWGNVSTLTESTRFHENRNPVSDVRV